MNLNVIVKEGDHLLLHFGTTRQGELTYMNSDEKEDVGDEEGEADVEVGWLRTPPWRLPNALGCP